MDLHYVELGGKKRGVYFGFNALRMFSKDTGLSLQAFNALGNDADADVLLKLAYYGLTDGARIHARMNNIPNADFFTLETFCDWLDEAPEVLETIISIRNQQQGIEQKDTKGNEKKVKAKS